MALQDDVWNKMTGSNPAKTAETRLVETDLKTSNLSAAVGDIQAKNAIIIAKLNEILAALEA